MPITKKFLLLTHIFILSFSSVSFSQKICVSHHSHHSDHAVFTDKSDIHTPVVHNHLNHCSHCRTVDLHAKSVVVSEKHKKTIRRNQLFKDCSKLISSRKTDSGLKNHFSECSYVFSIKHISECVNTVILLN